MKTTLLFCLLFIAGSGTAIAQPDMRRVATSIYVYKQGALVLADSTAMQYTGSKSYDTTLGQWLFDSSRSFDGNNAELFRRSNSYDGNNRLVQTLYHTFDGLWVTSVYNRYEYTPGGLLTAATESRFDGTSWDSIRNVYTYNTQGRILTNTDEYYDFKNNAWVSSSRILNTYNAAGKVDTMFRSSYHKNSNQWTDAYRTIYMFNTAQQLMQEVTEQAVGSAWGNYAYATYAYNAAGKLNVAFYRSWTNTFFSDISRHTYTYNGDDVLTLVAENNLNGVLIKTQERSYLYNTHHQPTQEDLKNWDNVAQQFVFKEFNFRNNYYYKDFSTGIKGSSAMGNSMRIYPVPAANTLNLELNNTTAQHTTVMMFDMNGRMVKQLHLPAVTQHSQRIDVSQLPVGQYTVQLVADGQAQAQSVNIVR